MPDLFFFRVPPRPVCARHAVRSALLARRRLRLTPEVNSGYLPAVARGPRALKDGLPASTLPLALCLGHNLPVHPVLLKQLQLRSRIRGVRGELFPPHVFSAFPAFPGALPPGGAGGERVAISASFLYTSLFQRVHLPSGAASRRERLRAGFPPPPGRVSASGCACARVGVRRSRRSPREGNFSNQVKEGMRT